MLFRCSGRGRRWRRAATTRDNVGQTGRGAAGSDDTPIGEGEAGPATILAGVWSRRPDLRRTHWLGHAEEDHDALAAAARRERLVVAEAAVDVLPVVHHPHVARRRDSEVRLHL